MRGSLPSATKADVDPKRIQKILTMLQCGELLKIVAENLKRAADGAAEDVSTGWQKRLTYTEQCNLDVREAYISLFCAGMSTSLSLYIHKCFVFYNFLYM